VLCIGGGVILCEYTYFIPVTCDVFVAVYSACFCGRVRALLCCALFCCAVSCLRDFYTTTGEYTKVYILLNIFVLELGDG
jgi:hypothetical protein